MDYCNGHADFCFAVDPDMARFNSSETDPSKVRFNVDEKTLHEMIKSVTRGPDSDAICVNCVDMTRHSPSASSPPII